MSIDSFGVAVAPSYAYLGRLFAGSSQVVLDVMRPQTNRKVALVW